MSDILNPCLDCGEDIDSNGGLACTCSKCYGQLRTIEAAARAYDEFVLNHGILRIRASQPLVAQQHLLHKAMHDALALSVPQLGGES